MLPCLRHPTSELENGLGFEVVFFLFKRVCIGWVARLQKKATFGFKVFKTSVTWTASPDNLLEFAGAL